jgi:hypothetical protein
MDNGGSSCAQTQKNLRFGISMSGKPLKGSNLSDALFKRGLGDLLPEMNKFLSPSDEKLTLDFDPTQLNHLLEDISHYVGLMHMFTMDVTDTLYYLQRIEEDIESFYYTIWPRNFDEVLRLDDHIGQVMYPPGFERNVALQAAQDAFAQGDWWTREDIHNVPEFASFLQVAGNVRGGFTSTHPLVFVHSTYMRTLQVWHTRYFPPIIDWLSAHAIPFAEAE